MDAHTYPTIRTDADFCVAGGGLAGLCAAISAARHGVKTVLVQDRSVLGGNASSEIRMHALGAKGANRRETGIIEELFLENYRYNPSACWPVFDTVLWEVAKREPNLRIYLDASICDCTMSGNTIASVKAWQTTTQKWIEISATFFADCTGDGVLAPLSGAEFRIGREGQSEFGESEAPEVADKCTMGNSILFQIAEYATEQTFTRPPWAYDFTKPELSKWIEQRHIDPFTTNFWWIEIGGADDSIANVEQHRDELLKIAYGVWDYVKNHSSLADKLKNFGLEWVGSLPGKRESRRYVGDHILTQSEVQSGGIFDDIVAYGGWKIDNHYPKGFYHDGPGTKYTDCPSPFGIPYRCLYSRNIANLMFAGRDISCSHVALSATRVMATCALEGQAVGTAVAVAVKTGLTPREVGAKRIAELQQMLADDDCFIPGRLRKVGELCATAKLSATGGVGVEHLRDGMDRDWDDGSHAWIAAPGDAAEYLFDGTAHISEVRIVFDSDLNRAECDRAYGGNSEYAQGRYYRALQDPPLRVPSTLVKAFRIETLWQDGKWHTVAKVADNHQRLVRMPLNCEACGIRLVPMETWGAAECRVFAFEAV